MTENEEFGEDYFSGGSKSQFEDYTEETEFDHTITNFRTIIKKFPAYGGTNVLDFGCAKGFLVKDMRKNRCWAYGVDISEYAIKNSVVPEFVKQYDGKTIPFKSDFFDYTVSFFVFEHIPPIELHKVLKEISRVTKTGLLIQLPIIYTSMSLKWLSQYSSDRTHCNINTMDYWISVIEQSTHFRFTDAQVMSSPEDGVQAILRFFDEEDWLETNQAMLL